MRTPREFPGFTLIELTITLAIIAILAGFLSTSWSSLIAGTGHTSVVNSTHRMFSAARSQAIHQQTLTTLCPLSSDLKCVDDWNQPVAIFPDRNNDKRPDNNRIYRTFNLSGPQSEIYSRTAGRGYFQLAPDGMSHGTMGSLVVCSKATGPGSRMSYLALNIGGRLRTLHDEDGDGVIRLPWGVTILCPWGTS